jgi:hypothetical protein
MEANAKVAETTETVKPATVVKPAGPAGSQARVLIVGEPVILIGNMSSRHNGRRMFRATVTAVGRGGKIDLATDDGEHVIHSCPFDPTNSNPDHWNFAA